MQVGNAEVHRLLSLTMKSLIISCDAYPRAVVKNVGASMGGKNGVNFEWRTKPLTCTSVWLRSCCKGLKNKLAK
jgi:hypothetical protein